MRIIIDMQGAQASNASRGIGRYTMALAQGIARLRGQHEVIVAASNAFSDSIRPLRETFSSVLPAENFCVWQCPDGISADNNANSGRRAAAELVREAFLASLRPDVVVISSLFEGLGDDAVASIGALHDVPTAVVLYDLIPYIYRRIYLTPNPVIEAWYETQLIHLRRADLLLAISGSSKKEAEDYLGFAPEQVANIGAAAEPQFHRQSYKQTALDAVLARYGLTRPFVMYTGGIDHRKNLDCLITAFARLPPGLRKNHQLAIVCKADDAALAHLKARAKQEGLGNADVVLTGFLPEDDLVAMYHACTAFIFPSWHEGFGLPALEAMSCGAPVIASNNSSLPEVVGRQDALFDPMSPDSIAAKLQEVLDDPGFRETLISHGLKQAAHFSWDTTARRTLDALEQLHRLHTTCSPAPAPAPAPAAATSERARRPRLAYVSPLPPEKSGISNYSIELLPELARFYNVELIVDQAKVEPQWLHQRFPVRSPDWLRINAASYERVLFHFGNSAFHHHMFELLHDVPGVVVLHDFFLSGVAWWMEHAGRRPGNLARALYQSHGYLAAQQRFKRQDLSAVIDEFPCSAGVIEDAIGIIAHGPHSLRLAEQWYGAEIGREWSMIPHLRSPVFQIDRQQARKRLGLPEAAIVVCSFGLLGPTKLNHILLEAWLASKHAGNPNARLIFVGENSSNDYGRGLESAIKSKGASDCVRITGWVDNTKYHEYLAAADIAVQLRARSRGETSGTVLDCLNYGVATIVNAHGSMADLADDLVWKLPGSFATGELVRALEILVEDAAERTALGRRGQDFVRTVNSPRSCAEQFHKAIEGAYQRANVSNRGAVGVIGRMPHKLTKADLAQIATCLAQNETRPRAKKILVDISELVVRDVKSGIQRVVRGILLGLLHEAPTGYRVEPVYACADAEGYRYARQWTMKFLESSPDGFDDDIVDVHRGDIFLALDLNYTVPLLHASLYRRWRTLGIRTHFVVYDLLPVRMPQHFLPGAAENHSAWLEVVAEADGVVCISRAVADDFYAWLREREPQGVAAMRVGCFYLGSDIENTAPTQGVPRTAERLLAQMNARPSFLMVGTVEPRKAHAQTLSAFEQLWRSGVDVNLVIVGKQGWMVEGLIKRFRSHPEAGGRLLWIADASDVFLEEIYAASTCLIAASEGEGFGLPIVEASRVGLPVIARDIPVFREIAQDRATYFSGTEPERMAKVISEWLALRRERPSVPRSKVAEVITWKESAAMLLEAIGIKDGQSTSQDVGSNHQEAGKMIAES